MTITLEKIKEMNIPVGTPIEIIPKNPLRDTREGYFQGVFREKPLPKGWLVYSNKKLKSKINIKVDPFTREGIILLYIPYIKEIKY